jgi:hypothetical protein
MVPGRRLGAHALAVYLSRMSALRLLRRPDEPVVPRRRRLIDRLPPDFVDRRRRSILSSNSQFSALSVFSLFSFASIASIGCSGSILSIGSNGSILSIGSAGSILSIGSAGSILSIGAAGGILKRGRRKSEREALVPDPEL